MGAHDVTDDHQAQPGAAVTGRAGEGLEQLVPGLRGQAGSVVGDVEGNPLTVTPGTDAHLAGARLDGVMTEIAQDPEKLFAVGFDLDPRGNFVGPLDGPPFAAGGLHLRPRLVHQAAQVEAAEGELDL